MQDSSTEHIQKYVSEELIHFVGRSLSTDVEQYELLKLILRSGELRNPGTRTTVDGSGFTTPFQGTAVMAGVASGRTEEVVFQKDGSVRNDDTIAASVVCFCDIPDGDLRLQMSKYSEFGIGFLKSHLIPLNIRPVLYLPLSAKSVFGTPGQRQWQAFDEGIRGLVELIGFQIKQELKRPGLDPLQPSKQMVRLTEMFQFVTRDLFGFVKVFNDELPVTDPDNYYMEREWRSTSSIPFQLTEVSSIVLPDKYVDTFASDFPEFKGNLKSVRQGRARLVETDDHRGDCRGHDSAKGVG